MNDMPWFRFFPSDWLGGTRGLTSSETGIYITLIAMMYERGGKIEANHARLSRLCGASNSAFSKAINTLIEDEKIILDEGLYTNNRVLEELSYRSKKETLAKKAAKSRWGEKSTKSKGEAKQPYSVGNAIPEARGHIPDKKVKEDTNVSSKRRVKDQDFDAWYSHYPHKVQRGAAEKAFPKALAQASLQELIDGVLRYIESKPVDRPYQNPATWLNGKGWLDQPAPPPTDLHQGRARQPRGADHFMISAMEDLKNEQFRNGQGEGDFGDDVPGFPFLLEHERR